MTVLPWVNDYGEVQRREGGRLKGRRKFTKVKGGREENVTIEVID